MLGLGAQPERRGRSLGRERAFLSGEAQRVPSRVFTSLEAAKGANPPLRLGQEARTSVPSSGGAEKQGGNGCPPCGGPGSWLERVCLSPGPAKKDQRSGCLRRLRPLSEAVRAGAGALTVSPASHMLPVPPRRTFYPARSLPVATLELRILTIPISHIRKLVQQFDQGPLVTGCTPGI